MIVSRRPLRALIATLAAVATVLLASNLAFAAVPPYPSPVPGRAVYDAQRILKPTTVSSAETAADGVRSAADLQLILYVEREPVGLSADAAGRNADALVEQWDIGNGGVLLFDVAADGCGGIVSVRRGSAIDPATVTDDELARVAQTAQTFLAKCDPDTAALVGISNLTVTLLGGGPGATPSGRPAASGALPGASPRPTATPRTAAVLPAGPPFPDPTPGRYVYDQAKVFRPDTIDKVQAQIQAIRDRTGAEIAVYTQVVPNPTEASAEEHARALMDQWGIGRRGFDDGLVILYDLDNSRQHGQVQLYAGPGYRAAFLSNGERQAIFENDMLPLLKKADLDGALLVAMDRVDANATADHAATLERARQINAVIGLVGAPIVLLLLVAWPLIHWLRFGRDPDYLDDPSIYMPAPPPDLTAAAGALVFDGRSSRHTLTTALLDLASRDEIAFRPEVHALAKDKLGIEVHDPNVTDPRIVLNRRKPISPAELQARFELSALTEPSETGAAIVDSKQLLKFGPKVSDFDKALEAYATAKGWFRQPPAAAMSRWFGQGLLELLGGIALIVIAINLPSDGLVLVGGALVIAGIVTMAIARFMPARTMPGAVIKAMLSAYRRTLQKTLEMSRSMDQVVASRVLPWLETPDQAVVWGVALGLRKDVEDVLLRTATDIEHGRADLRSSYLPTWYGTGNWGGGGSVGGGGFAPGLLAGSAVPNFGSMMSAIGTIGNSPSSSGGYGGGGSGGGGGGAGGGF